MNIGMDIGQFDTKAASEKGAEMYLRNPGTKRPIADTEGNFIVFQMIGKHSEQYIKTQMRVSNRRLKEMRGRGPSSTAEELEDETIELLSAAIVGWTNLALDGSAFEYSITNARKLLSDPRLRWIREQVDEFVGDISNFLIES